MLRLLLLAVSSAPIAAWITLTQSRQGVSLAEIQAFVTGRVVDAQKYNLGYIWNSPSDPNDSSGLGAGITWAIDPALCDSLTSTSSCMAAGSSSSCAAFRTAAARAMQSWAANNRFIDFVDVNDQCASQPTGSAFPHKGCELAELWITNATNATASPFFFVRLSPAVRYRVPFRFTNGASPVNEASVPRRVIETYSAVIRVNTDVCWQPMGPTCGGRSDGACAACKGFQEQIAHYIGLMLGLGRPVAGAPPQDDSPGGRNVFNAALAAGGYANASSWCHAPWAGVVELSDDPTPDPTVATALMADPNNRTSALNCGYLTRDDLNGLSTLYPDCVLPGQAEPIGYAPPPPPPPDTPPPPSECPGSRRVTETDAARCGAGCIGGIIVGCVVVPLLLLILWLTGAFTKRGCPSPFARGEKKPAGGGSTAASTASTASTAMDTVNAPEVEVQLSKA